MHNNFFNFRSISSCLLFTLLLGGLYSCSKDENTVEEKERPVEQEIPTDNNLFYKLQRVENVSATQENNTATEAQPVFYSLENKTIRAVSHQKSRNWDIAFGGLYNSFLSGNNGIDNNNFGKGSQASGGILILEQAFDDVIDIPAEIQFKTASNLIGTDDHGDLGQGKGWYLYDFDGLIVRNGQDQDKHVAYALPSGLTLKNGTVVPPRTIVIKTAKGHFAKVKMISCYKDLFHADQWMRSSPKMFFTFEYLMVPKGSTKFELK